MPEEKEKFCLVCGKELNGRQLKYCSKKCMGLGKQGYKKCVVCGKEFKEWVYSPKNCCSPECSHVRRRQLYDSGVTTDIGMVRDKMFELSDKLGASRRWGTKHWVIQSPGGQVYEVDNLFNFIKSNPGLFDGTERQAYDGFMKIKLSVEGKRKNPSSSWKGWRLISWSENENAYVGKEKRRKSKSSKGK